MRTTLKRGVGRGAHVNGNGRENGHAVFPPTAVTAIRRYEQPPVTRRLGLFSRFVLGFLLLMVAVVAGAGGGVYFAHPESRYFAVARIGRDQLEDYAHRKGEPVEAAERWLRPNLG